MPSGDGGHDLATDSSTLVNEDAHWRIVPVSTGEQGHHLVPDEPMPAGSGQGGHLASNRRFHSGERGPLHKDELCMSLMARAVQKHPARVNGDTWRAYTARKLDITNEINGLCQVSYQTSTRAKGDTFTNNDPDRCPLYPRGNGDGQGLIRKIGRTGTVRDPTGPPRATNGPPRRPLPSDGPY